MRKCSAVAGRPSLSEKTRTNSFRRASSSMTIQSRGPPSRPTVSVHRASSSTQASCQFSCVRLPTQRAQMCPECVSAVHEADPALGPTLGRWRVAPARDARAGTIDQSNPPPMTPWSPRIYADCRATMRSRWPTQRPGMSPEPDRQSWRLLPLGRLVRRAQWETNEPSDEKPK